MNPGHSDATEAVGLLESRAPEATATGADLLCLCGRHAQAAVRLAFHLTRDREAALDISQEAFVRALSSLPRLEDPARVEAWFLRIVVNLCRDWQRRRGAERRAMKGWAEDQRGRSRDDAPGPDLNDEAGRARAALLELPIELREALALVCIEGLAPRDAAVALGVPEGTLRWRLHEGRQRLRSALAER